MSMLDDESAWLKGMEGKLLMIPSEERSIGQLCAKVQEAHEKLHNVLEGQKDAENELKTAQAMVAEHRQRVDKAHMSLVNAMEVLTTRVTEALIPPAHQDIRPARGYEGDDK